MDNLFDTILLVLEVGGFGIPLVNFIRDGIKGHDSLHEWSGDPSNKEAEDDIVVCDASMGDITVLWNMEM